MATASIGSSGRDYSTVQAWEDALAGTLTEAEVGECHNDSEFDLGSSNILTIAGHTTSATNTITLKCAAGKSFSDNANVRTNALRYNASNGVAFKSSGTYTDLIAVQDAYVTIEGLQVYASSGPTRAITNLSDDNCTYRNLVVEAENSGSLAVCRLGYGSSVLAVNVLAVNRGTGGQGIEIGNGGRAINCVAVRPSNITAAGDGFGYYYGTPRMDNCASFGFTTAVESSGSWSGSSSNNATDQASGLPGSGTNYSVTYSSTTPFVSADESGGSHDFRLANDGNDLIDAGTEDATNAPTDISGQARDTACEIGVWELAAAPAGGQPYMKRVGGVPFMAGTGGRGVW
jgi:hypothetical protein